MWVSGNVPVHTVVSERGYLLAEPEDSACGDMKHSSRLSEEVPACSKQRLTLDDGALLQMLVMVMNGHKSTRSGVRLESRLPDDITVFLFQQQHLCGC